MDQTKSGKFHILHSFFPVQIFENQGCKQNPKISYLKYQRLFSCHGLMELPQGPLGPLGAHMMNMINSQRLS